MKEYAVLKRSKAENVDTTSNWWTIHRNIYIIVYKRQKLQRGSLLHRMSPIEDIGVVYSGAEEIPYKFEPVEGEVRSVWRKLDVGYTSQRVLLMDF